MTNKEIAQKLNLIADILELKSADPFEIRAYQQAARAAEFQTKELSEVVERQGVQELEKISGIGKTISQNIAELVKTGTCSKLERLIKKTPAVMIEMMSAPGVGPKTSKKLYQLLKPKNLSDLVKRLRSPRNTRKLEKASILAKSIGKILRGIKIYQSASGRMLLSQALPRAESLVTELRRLPEVKKVEYVGSLRRRKETIGDIDLIVAQREIKNQKSKSKSANQKSKIIKQFLEIARPKQIVAQGESKATVIDENGVQIDLEIMPAQEWGSLRHHFTGSKEHNIKLRALAERKGFSFSEHGFKKINRKKEKIDIYCPTEKKVFSTLKIQYIPPELREGGDEIKAAAHYQIPKLVELKNITGDLQLHSRWSDGRTSILEMAQGCKNKGYEYMAMTDHSSGLGVIRASSPNRAARGSGGGISPKNYQRYFKAISEVNRKMRGIRVLTGIEVNIRPDGSLDQPDDFLEKFEIVLAGVHSSFSQPKEKTTQRLIKVLQNPCVDGIVHPSGRIIDKRPEIQADWLAVFQKAKEYKKVLEINSAPNRLDLKDVYIKKAKELGVKFIISTDAHTPAQLDFMQYGIYQARRGWLTKKDVANTLSLAGIKKFFGI